MNVRERQRRYRIPIAASHFVTWRLGRWFPEAIPLWYVTGYPKSGTTWVTQLLADALRLPYPRQSLLPVGCAAVVHGHQRVVPGLRRGAYVARDGRDAMVSYYFHLSSGIPPGAHPRLSRRQRRLFPRLHDRSDIASNLPAFIERMLTAPVASSGLNWNDHVLSYLEGTGPLQLVRYEDLLSGDTLAMVDLVASSGMPRAEAKQAIDHAMERYSFKRITGRAAGREDRSSFLRSGTPGDWRKHFNREAAEIFRDSCQPALEALGYEEDASWVDAIATELPNTELPKAA